MKLIIIYGPPAVGKLTVGRELAKRTGFKLFHNHLTVDDADALFPEIGPRRIDLLETLRRDEITAAAKANVDMIFTFAYSGTVDDHFIDTLIQAVERYDGKVCFVQLTAPEAALLERVKGESRKHVFGKMTNSDIMQQWLEARKGYTTSVKHADNLIIDTARFSPRQSAKEIISHYHLTDVNS